MTFRLNRKNSKKNDLISSLTAPIPGDNPVGAYQRYEGLYDEIIEARRGDDANLPQGVWQTNIKQANWDQVERLCIECLQHDSKDLQVAAWLSECWLIKNGIAGLRRGILLLDQLSSTYWDCVYPQLRDDEYSFRLAPFEWLNEKVSQRIEMMPLTQPTDPEYAIFSLADFKMIQQQGAVANSQDNKEPGQLSSHNFSESQTRTPAAFYQEILEDTKNTLNDVSNLENKLILLTDKDAISLHQLTRNHKNLQQITMVLIKRSKPAYKVEQREKVTQEKANMNEVAHTSDDTKPQKGPTRDELYKKLSLIAAELEKSEPHSPTPYLIKKAISWGNMSLHEWINEMSENDMDIKHIQKWLGIS